MTPEKSEDPPRKECRDALEMLLAGNRRFMEGRSEHPGVDAERRALLLSRQEPFAAVVSCADSRVPVSRVFDQGLGDLFTVRVAGNVASRSVIGSIEYAVAVLGVRVVAVLGHEQCGAVQAAIDGAGATNAIERILEEIRPAVTPAREHGDDLLDATVRTHTRKVAVALRERSGTVRALVNDGELLVVPMLYRLESGEVELLG